MDVSLEQLRDETARVLDAFRAGEHVTLTMRGKPIADIVPHGGRPRWIAGAALGDHLARRAADAGLRHDLDELSGQTLADLRGLKG
jgi:antitoxin (DNA-binding transcriptional repressor) of toxin-antitoxin stability system